LVARAQQTAKMRRIAVVHPSQPIADLRETGSSAFFRAFFNELRRLGYLENSNIIVERHTAEGRTDRYAEVARQVVNSGPDLVLAVSPEMVQPFKAATTTIPIVAIVADPIAFGFIASLARPGGNITGVAVDAGLTELWGKRLQLLKELVPAPSKRKFAPGPPLAPILPDRARGPRPVRMDWATASFNDFVSTDE